jgi:O-antigen ligase
LGTEYVARLLDQPQINNWVENGWGELILEMGILGPVLWLIWSGSVLYYAWKIVRHLRGTIYFPVAFSIFWYAFLLLIPFTYGGLSSYQNYVMNAYFWLLMGVLYRLPHLARQEVVGASQVTAPTLHGFAAYPGGR